MDEIQFLALETIEMKKQAIIFAPSRASAEKTAEDISKLTKFDYPELEQQILDAASTPTKQCRRLSHCIKRGVAFHHAGLLAEQRNLIEDEFRKGQIKVICCTPTLAAGMSLPAYRVIIKSLKRFSGSWGMNWIPVLEYLQMAGRAGRPEYEKFGEALSIAKDEAEKEEIYEKYICGVPEEITSKLAVEPVLRTYLLSLISSGIIRDDKSMKEFFAKTFWAYHFKDLPRIELIMDKMINLLLNWKFVKTEGTVEGATEEANSDFVSASNLSKTKEHKYIPTLIGKRVSELYLDPLTAKHILYCLENYNANKNVFSLLQMISHTLEIRPLLRVKSKDEDKIQEELIKKYDLLLEKEPSAFDPEYDEFICSIKTALFFESWINEKDEDFLLENYNIAPGEIRVKIDIADWLLYASEELAKLSNFDKELIKEISKLRIRIQNGVKEDILNLIKLKGIGRVRARKLVYNNLKDLGDLKKVDITTLSQVLGKAVAEDVKKQLGEEVKEVPMNTRKGQLSIQKF